MKAFLGGMTYAAIACVVIIPFSYADEKVSWGAFVDTYYAYDFNNPPSHDRVLVNSGANGITNTYTTTAARSNEFNINMAYLEAKVVAEDYRGRLALQTGTSVEVNDVNEPSVGIFGGPTLSRNIQEASIGYHVDPTLWIDAGIFPSYLGIEDFISKDNWTYTRSLSGDSTPYFESGVKATYKISDQVVTQFHVMNGWTNLTEDNGNKSIGLQVVYTPNSTYSFTYNNFYGLMAPGNVSRFFNQVIGRIAVSPKIQFAASFDIGFQEKPDQSGMANWHDVTLLMRTQISQKWAASFRLEDYGDPYQLDVTTGTPNGFQTWGYSVGLDCQPKERVLWRTEYRELFSRDPVFVGSASPSSQDPLIVTSLSLSIQ
jgi:Putative beta-barrel porin-2, OmpL-like. bbp2